MIEYSNKSRLRKDALDGRRYQRTPVVVPACGRGHETLKPPMVVDATVQLGYPSIILPSRIQSLLAGLAKPVPQSHDYCSSKLAALPDLSESP